MPGVASERLDLFADVRRSADAIASFSGAEEGRRFLSFCAEARRIYDTLRKPFLMSQRPDPVKLATANGLGGMTGMLRINPFETMWTALGRHFSDPRLRQLFGRYATYCGSSPFEAPATLMLVAHVEQEGVWAVTGGMHRLALALESLATGQGAAFRYGAEVRGIETNNGRVSAVKLATGEVISCSEVIVNCDANALATALFGPAAARVVGQVAPPERSLSAVIWTVRAQSSGFPLTRHNVFFSDDYAAEFRALQRAVPDDPTVYICAQDRDDAISGPERLLMLVNAPATGDTLGTDVPRAEAAMRRRLQVMRPASGLAAAGLRRHRPRRIRAIVSGHGRRTLWKGITRMDGIISRPAAATALPGLFLAGGSVHPGPGVPMAALSGRLAAESLLNARVSTRWFRRTATAGGISTR